MEKKNYKAELKKTEKGTYIIKMSEFYGTGYTGQEAEVSEEVLDYLIAQKRHEKKKELDDYRNRSAYSFDENSAGEIWGQYESSAEEKYFNKLENDLVGKAMNELDEVSLRRFNLYYAAEYKLKEIAEMENVSITAVYYNIKSTTKRLQKIMCRINNKNL